MAIWTAPQTIIYGIIYLLIRKKIVTTEIYKICGINVKSHTTGDSIFSNIGLGFGCFHLARCPEDEAEEVGHCKQSFWLGWLFIPLFIISLPTGKWMDKWAEKLGGKIITQGA